MPVPSVAGKEASCGLSKAGEHVVVGQIRRIDRKMVHDRLSKFVLV